MLFASLYCFSREIAMPDWNNDTFDDIDQLFVRLPKVDPPKSLKNNVLSSLSAPYISQAPAKSAAVSRKIFLQGILSPSGWQRLAIITGFVFFAGSIWLGSALDSSGFLSLLGEISGNLGSLGNSSYDYGSALLGVAPWGELAVTFISLILFMMASSISIDAHAQKPMKFDQAILRKR